MVLFVYLYFGFALYERKTEIQKEDEVPLGHTIGLGFRSSCAGGLFQPPDIALNKGHVAPHCGACGLDIMRFDCGKDRTVMSVGCINRARNLRAKRHALNNQGANGLNNRLEHKMIGSLCDHIMEREVGFHMRLLVRLAGHLDGPAPFTGPEWETVGGV